MTSRRLQTRWAGFTLVELAVVMALLATLLTLSYPSFADWIARQRVHNAAETLVADLYEARLLAAQKGRSAHLAFTTSAASGGGADSGSSGGSGSSAPSPAWCWAVATAAPCDCNVPQPCRLKWALGSDHKGVQLTSMQPASFNPDGTGHGSAELRSARGHTLRVEVNLLGRPRICQPGGTDPRYAPC